MLKLTSLILCIALIGSAMSLSDDIVSGKAEEIARWAGSKMGTFYGADNEFLLQNIASFDHSQDNDNFKFDMTVSYSVDSDASAFKSCRLTVVDSPTKNVRLFDSRPVCVDQ